MNESISYHDAIPRAILNRTGLRHIQSRASSAHTGPSSSQLRLEGISKVMSGTRRVEVVRVCDDCRERRWTAVDGDVNIVRSAAAVRRDHHSNSNADACLLFLNHHNGVGEVGQAVNGGLIPRWVVLSLFLYAKRPSFTSSTRTPGGGFVSIDAASPSSAPTVSHCRSCWTPQTVSGVALQDSASHLLNPRPLLIPSCAFIPSPGTPGLPTSITHHIETDDRAGQLDPTLPLSAAFAKAHA